MNSHHTRLAATLIFQYYVNTKAALSSQSFQLLPYVLVRPGFEPATSRSADRRSPTHSGNSFITLEFITDHWRLTTDKKPEGST